MLFQFHSLLLNNLVKFVLPTTFLFVVTKYKRAKFALYRNHGMQTFSITETNGAVETLAPTNVCLPEQSVAVRPSLPPPNPNRAPKDRTVASTNDSLHKKLGMWRSCQRRSAAEIRDVAS